MLSQISWKGVLERAPRLCCYDATHSCRARSLSLTFALSPLLHSLSLHLEERGSCLVSGNKGTRMLRLPFQGERYRCGVCPRPVSTQLTTFRKAQAPHPLCRGCLTLGDEQSIPACLGAPGQHRSSWQKKAKIGCHWLCTLAAVYHRECDAPQRL